MIGIVIALAVLLAGSIAGNWLQYQKTLDLKQELWRGMEWVDPAKCVTQELVLPWEEEP